MFWTLFWVAVPAAVAVFVVPLGGLALRDLADRREEKAAAVRHPAKRLQGDEEFWEPEKLSDLTRPEPVYAAKGGDGDE